MSKQFLAAGERRMPKANVPPRDVAAEPKAERGPRSKPGNSLSGLSMPPLRGSPVALFGSQLKLARTAGISKNTLFETLHGYRNVSDKLALAIERATEGRVTAEELLLEGTPPTPPIAPDENKPQKSMPKRKRRAARCDELAGAAE